LAVLAALVVAALYLARWRGPLARTTAAIPDGSASPRARERAASTKRLLSLGLTAAESAATAIVGRVQSERGLAIAGARVCLAESRAECCAELTCSETNAAGRFVLQLQLASAPTLFVSHAGYLPLTERSIDAKTRGSLVLTLKPGGVQVSGTVMDAAGGPLVGAELRASDQHERPLALGVSDGSGRFLLDVAPGVTHIFARAAGYTEDQREVEAPLAGVEFRLAAASSISGRVVAAATGAPVGNVLVSAESADEPRELSVRSQDDGTFRLTGLKPTRYSLVAASERWRSETLSVVLELAQSAEAVELRVRPATQLLGVVQLDGAPCPSAPVTLLGPVQRFAETGPDGSVDIDGLTAGLYRADVRCQAARVEETISVGDERVSRVWNLKGGFRIAGVALSMNGAPVAGALVVVKQVGSPTDRASATTDPHGEFSCAGLETGEYEVALVSEPPRTEPVRVHLNSERTARVVLRTHAEAAIRVRLDGAQRFDAATLSVTAARSGAPPLRGELKGDTFVFDAVPLGVYDVRGDFGAASAAQRVPLTRDGEIAELTLALPDAHSIRGVVVDEEGNAVPDAWVRASTELASGAPAVTQAALGNSDGAFIVSGLAPGRYTLSARAAQGEGQLPDVQSDSAPATVRVRTFGSISGRLRDSAGADVPDFVVLYRLEGVAGPSMATGSRGVWSLPWLAPGKYELSAQSAENGQTTALGHVLLPPGGKLNVELELALTAHAGLEVPAAVGASDAPPTSTEATGAAAVAESPD
jgi:hypothetical protein